ncbi:MAG: hypothetical protein OQK09_09035 [Colwellia sp.]|nr:hypothetical protein [Colwellia sp.]MCW9081642.1 hypothetical protein [Colwellia sp.]
MSKHVKVGEWIFEIKMVRALKVDQYGQPYSAIANCNINGDTMYIDGLLTKDKQTFTKDDFDSFTEFGKIMDLKQISYHRYQNGKSVTKDVMVEPSDNLTNFVTDNTIRLVK